MRENYYDEGWYQPYDPIWEHEYGEPAPLTQVEQEHIAMVAEQEREEEEANNKTDPPLPTFHPLMIDDGVLDPFDLQDALAESFQWEDVPRVVGPLLTDEEQRALDERMNQMEQELAEPFW